MDISTSVTDIYKYIYICLGIIIYSFYGVVITQETLTVINTDNRGTTQIRNTDLTFDLSSKTVVQRWTQQQFTTGNRRWINFIQILLTFFVSVINPKCHQVA